MRKRPSSPPSAKIIPTLLRSALAVIFLVVGVADQVSAASGPQPVPPSVVPSVKVPLPRLRPPQPVASATTTAAAGPAKIAPAVPAFVASANSRFSPDQQLALNRITQYFNSFRTLEGRFVQVGPNGEQSEGLFNLSRPGNVRFRYNPPSKLDVIADGRSIAIRDGANNTQDLYPLSRTPLRYLLAEQVDLTNDRVVDSVREEPDLISVLIIERSAFVDGKLALIFDRKSFELRQWIVTDAQGLNTSVAIYNVARDKPQDPKQFYISTSVFQ